MPTSKPQTFGELKQHVSHLPDIRAEMRKNLIRKLEKKERLFPNIIGYDESVLPALINAVLCGHNIILLGERGQGKSRIIRNMIDFLDDDFHFNRTLLNVMQKTCLLYDVHILMELYS